MFLKKSLLFTTALALLMFAGQASAQPTVSLEHVTDGTAGMVEGSGTTITVRISQTGVNDIPGLAAAGTLDIALAFDNSLVSLSAVPLGLLKIDNDTGSTLTIPAPPGGTLSVPASADLTFTTVADVTDVEFSIGITGASVVTAGGAVSVPVMASVTFNEGATGTPGDGNGGDNGGTGTPMPTDLTVSLTRVGEGAVAAGGNVVINVAVPDLTGESAGARIVFTVDPPVAAITAGMPATGLGIVESETSGMQVVLAGLPMMLPGGNFGSVVLTLSPAYDGSMVSINASATVFTTAGEMSAAAGDPVMVSGGPIPMLETESSRG